MPLPLKKKLKTGEEEEPEEHGEHSDQAEDEEKEDEKYEVDGFMSGDDDEDDDEGDSEDDSDFEENADVNEEIMIDFEARSLRASDLDSTKLMIKQKLGPFQSININELAKLVVEQERVGNAIYQVVQHDDDDEGPTISPTVNRDSDEDDEDSDDTIFGILSVIDLTSQSAKSFATGLKTFLLKQCESWGHKNKAPNSVNKLKEVFETKKVAYIVNERYVNIPPAISVPMFASLRKDLDALNPAENACNDADYWLFLAKFFIETPHEKNHDAPRSSSKRDEAAVTASVAPINIYSNPEEEIFEEFSDFKFDISYSGRISNSTSGKWSDSDASLTPNLRVFLVPKKSVTDALAKVEQLVK